ncbi:MAG: hypothetical protein ACRCZP_17360 [Phycicoccus sp.]
MSAPGQTESEADRLHGLADRVARDGFVEVARVTSLARQWQAWAEELRDLTRRAPVSRAVDGSVTQAVAIPYATTPLLDASTPSGTARVPVRLPAWARSMELDDRLLDVLAWARTVSESLIDTAGVVDESAAAEARRLRAQAEVAAR